MTVIRPNSISGVTSITAMANEINVFKHDGVLAGLQLNGVNHHTSSGVSTFHTLNVLGNVSVGGTLTYQDVTNVDSVGVITARDTIDAQGSINLADSIIHSGDTDTKIRFPAANTISFETNGAERLRIRSDGKVGIGTDMVGTPASNYGFAFYRATGTGYLYTETGQSGASAGLRAKAGTSDFTIFTTQGVGQLAVYDNTNSAERLRIDSSGRVLIGTTSSAYKLCVADNTNAPLVSQLVNTNTGSSTKSIFQIQTGSNRYVNFENDYTGQYIHVVGSGITTYFSSFDTHRFRNNAGTERLRITSDGKVGINEYAPENQLHIAGTTDSSAGGLLRLDATTGDNFIIFDNTADNSEWVIGNDSGNNDKFRLYYNGGSGYGDPIINVDGTPSNGKVTIDGGTSTLVNVRANSSGTAGLRCGGSSGAGSDQCTGYVEVHQDESHGGGFFYNGDASPSFASSNEAADFFSIHRLSAGQRHVVQRWFHSNNDCEMFGNLLIDNGNTTTLTVRGNSSGTAGVRAGGSSGSGSNQCTGYLEAHQDEAHGGGISYNGDGSPGFVNNETADHITFYRMSNGTRERVFSYPYNTNSVSFRGGISASSKSFRITHPHPSKKDTHDLIHSSIEGPQCDNIYRGKVDLVGGTATVNIDTVSNMTDGTFVLLNRDIQCFTTNETGWTNVKGSVTGNILTIIAQDNTCTDTISWMVVGERQDDTIKSSEIETTDADGKLIVELLKGS